MAGTPEEFKNKIPITIGAIIWIAGVSFFMGKIYTENLNVVKDIISNKVDAKNYTEQEVGGLRSDWERNNEISKQDREAHLKRIEELEKYHKE